MDTSVRCRTDVIGIARRARDAALTYIARPVIETDELTGIGNRRAFNRALREMASKVRRGRIEDGALIFIDLDGFKGINDTLGHDAGDRVLEGVAGVLSKTVRNYDGKFRLRKRSSCRFGGDEFGVLIPGADIETAWKISRRIKEAINDEFGDSGVGASIGYGTLKEIAGAERSFTKQEQPKIQSEFLFVVDGRMYEAKHGYLNWEKLTL